MGCTIRVTTYMCFKNMWRMCRGVYWARKGGSGTKSRIVMSRTGGSCPGTGETKEIQLGSTATFGSGEYTVKLLSLSEGSSTIEVWRTSELESEPDTPEHIPDNGFGFGRGEITQTNINNGLIHNVGSHIECSLRVMNTGETNKIYGAVGLGYHDNEGRVFYTGRYMIDDIELPGGETYTWNPSIEVLHKDYAARKMTPRGPAIYFMSGHDENGKVVWDRSEYIPVELILESGYVDPLDPEGVPDDWPDPVVDEPGKPDDTPGFLGVIFTMPDIKEWINKSIMRYIIP